MSAAGGGPLGYLQGANVLYELEDPETQIGRAEQNDIVRGAHTARRWGCLDVALPRQAGSPRVCSSQPH